MENIKVALLYFYLLVCCGAAEGFTEKLVDLGGNVTLKCELSVKTVFWLLMKPPEPPVFILQSYSSKSLSANYSNPAFNKTFSLQYNSSLFIHNISTNELGLYYCIQLSTLPGSPPEFSSGIRLYIQNHSAENQTCDCEQQPNQTTDNCEDVRLWRRLFITLGIIICVVVTVVIVRCCKRPATTQAQPPDPGLQQHQDNTSPEYAEVQYNRTNGCVRINNPNSTYSLLQPPKPVTQTNPTQL